MAYVVRWILAGQTKIRQAQRAYGTPSEAIDFACVILRERPEKIWIEGPNGIRIEHPTIKANCEARGMR